jgi:hypothetical protein
LKPTISFEIKREIVQLWLMGLQRDKIADSLNVSAGTVSHTVSDWRDRLGAPLAEEVRDFCVIVKTQNITPLQCAEGFRFLNQLKNCNLSLDQIMPFILEFYKVCISANMEPKEIFSICNEIFELQDAVPLAQLPEFISGLVERKRSLESDISKVELAIKGLQQEYIELFDKVSINRFDVERYKKVEQLLANMSNIIHIK